MISTFAARGRLPLALLPFAAASTQICHAQEALQNAIAVDRIAQAQTNFGVGQNTFGQDVNVLHWGPAQFTVGVSYSLEFNDNVNLTETDARSDLISTPALYLGMAVPLSARSTLTIRVGLGYSFYVENSDLSRFYLTPNSDLYWSIPISRDLTISFYDRFSYTSDPLIEPSLSGVGEFEQFQNTIGTMISWQPDRYLLSFGYSHNNSLAGSSGYSYLDNSSEQFFTRAGYRFTDATQAGIEGTASFLRYDQGPRADYNNYSVGPYFTWKILENLDINVRGGLTYYDFQNRVPGPSQGSFTSYYAGFGASHRLTEHISHSLSFFTGIEPGVSSTLSELSQRMSFGYGPIWAFHREASLNASINYEMGDESTVGFGQKYSRLGFGIGVSANLTVRWNTGLHYQFYTRDSNFPGGDYQNNIVTLYVSYAF